ncbi:phosphatase PAP2 family protein [Streptomyces sp. H39-S7]|uniref:phosphatase PAP2 family protein n=1 Tax=Streptomyces sp. H39-S7 TaxID=3004357 RepID=UPI0022AF5D2C|nr:phosphatase PAP2 family protein [Streptomyces sp. H39-S7]MCZ4124372.1 phosphatase PAP2 family protein [Streptomyces sp. H39-S7]
MRALSRFPGNLIHRLRGPDERLGVRLLLTAAAFAVATVPFALVLVLVEAHWGPLHRADRGAAENLHRAALDHPAWVTVLRFLTNGPWSPTVMRLLVAAVVVWLLYRRAWRLAAWAAVTSALSSSIGVLVKVAVERARPQLPDPVAHAPGYSFPSGHAMTATTSCGILLLVLLPLVPRRLRPLAWAAAVVSVVGVGYTRVALGVHWASDVVGGWLLGLALLIATTAAFQAWRQEAGLAHTSPAQGLEPELDTPTPHTPPEPTLDLGHHDHTAPPTGHDRRS